jgi:hypothetical protein
MKQWLKNKWKKTLNAGLDILLFIVPVLEVTELIAVIPYEYLPWYMLGALILRRTARYLEDYMEKKDAGVVEDNKEQ